MRTKKRKVPCLTTGKHRGAAHVISCLNIGKSFFFNYRPIAFDNLCDYDAYFIDGIFQTINKKC